MKCPLKDILAATAGINPDDKRLQCDSDCAWFDYNNGVCAVKGLRQVLESLAMNGISVYISGTRP